jgi:hypothetical protein
MKGCLDCTQPPQAVIYTGRRILLLPACVIMIGPELLSLQIGGIWHRRSSQYIGDTGKQVAAI